MPLPEVPAIPRFSLLLLEDGESYLLDFVATCEWPEGVPTFLDDPAGRGSRGCGGVDGGRLGPSGRGGRIGGLGGQDGRAGRPEGQGGRVGGLGGQGGGLGGSLADPEPGTPASPSRLVRGSLRVCSHSIFFDPDDPLVPIVRVPFAGVQGLEAPGPRAVSLSSPHAAFLRPGMPVLRWMREIFPATPPPPPGEGGTRGERADDRGAPASRPAASPPPSFAASVPRRAASAPLAVAPLLWRFTLSWASAGDVLVAALPLLAASQSPPMEMAAAARATVAALNAELRFDVGLLRDASETPVVSARACLISPLISEPCFLVASESRLYAAPLRPLSGLPSARSHPLRGVLAVARRRVALLDVGLEVFFRKPPGAGGGLIGGESGSGDRDGDAAPPAAFLPPLWDEASALFRFPCREARDDALRGLLSLPALAATERPRATFRGVDRAGPPGAQPGVGGAGHSGGQPGAPPPPSPRAVLEGHPGALRLAQRAWLRGRLSNFDYLLYLNLASGRSFRDAAQWPVFPWIVADWRDEALAALAAPTDEAEAGGAGRGGGGPRPASLPPDATDPTAAPGWDPSRLSPAAASAIFRDLSRPVGAQDPARVARLRAARDELAALDPERPPFLYGTHYSTPAYVSGFLLRASPAHGLRVQGGRYDSADRIFRNVEGAWRSATQGPADVRELIPEFFLPDDPVFLLNLRRLGLGTTAAGDVVGDVELPPLAHGDPTRFLRLHARLLEAAPVSASLHRWIDLVFGVDSRGEAARFADNQFASGCYGPDGEARWGEPGDELARPPDASASAAPPAPGGDAAPGAAGRASARGGARGLPPSGAEPSPERCEGTLAGPGPAHPPPAPSPPPAAPPSPRGAALTRAPRAAAGWSPPGLAGAPATPLAAALSSEAGDEMGSWARVEVSDANDAGDAAAAAAACADRASRPPSPRQEAAMREAAETLAQEFGQQPRWLFSAPHPRRHVATGGVRSRSEAGRDRDPTHATLRVVLAAVRSEAMLEGVPPPASGAPAEAGALALPDADEALLDAMEAAREARKAASGYRPALDAAPSHARSLERAESPRARAARDRTASEAAAADPFAQGLEECGADWTAAEGAAGAGQRASPPAAAPRSTPPPRPAAPAAARPGQAPTLSSRLGGGWRAALAAAASASQGSRPEQRLLRGLLGRAGGVATGRGSADALALTVSDYSLDARPESALTDRRDEAASEGSGVVVPNPVTSGDADEDAPGTDTEGGAPVPAAAAKTGAVSEPEIAAKSRAGAAPLAPSPPRTESLASSRASSSMSGLSLRGLSPLEGPSDAEEPEPGLGDLASFEAMLSGFEAAVRERSEREGDALGGASDGASDDASSDAWGGPARDAPAGAVGGAGASTGPDPSWLSGVAQLSPRGVLSADPSGERLAAVRIWSPGPNPLVLAATQTGEVVARQVGGGGDPGLAPAAFSRKLSAHALACLQVAPLASTGAEGRPGGAPPAVVYAGAYDGRIYTCSLGARGPALAPTSWQAAGDTVAALALCEGGPHLASGSWDGAVSLWDVGQGAPTVPLQRLPGLGGGGIWSLDAAAGAASLAAGTEDGLVAFLDARSNLIAWSGRASADYVGGVALLPGGRCDVLAACADGALVVLEGRAGGRPRQLRRARASLRCLVAGPGLAIAGGDDGGIVALALPLPDAGPLAPSLAPLRPSPAIPIESLHAVAGESGGVLVAAGREDGTVALWGVS